MTTVYYIQKSEIRDSSWDSAAGVSLLRYALMRDFGIADAVILKTDAGKPYLRDHSGVHFSISHTKTCVACAVADHPVGLDVESVRDKDRSRVARRMFTENEQRFVFRDGSEADPDRFCRVWVQKESFVKLTGEGISRSFADFDVLTGRNTGDAVFVPLDIPGTAACICMKIEDRVTIHELSETELQRKL